MELLNLLLLLLPFLAVGNIFGDIFGGIGDVVGKAAPFASFIPGVGPIASTVLGAGGNLLGGLNDEGGGIGSLEDILKGGAAGGLGGLLISQLMNQNAAGQRAGELSEEAVRRANQASDIAMGQFGMNEPLRQEFRLGALNAHDPTNPFSGANPAMSGTGGGMIGQGMQGVSQRPFQPPVDFSQMGGQFSQAPQAPMGTVPQGGGLLGGLFRGAQGPAHAAPAVSFRGTGNPQPEGQGLMDMFGAMGGQVPQQGTPGQTTYSGPAGHQRPQGRINFGGLV